MKLMARSLTKKLVYPLDEIISDQVVIKYIYYSNQNAYKTELPRQCLKYLVYNVNKDQKRLKIVYTLMQMMVRYPQEMLVFSSELVRQLEGNDSVSAMTKCLICFAKQSIITDDYLTDQRLEAKIRSISGFVIWGSTLVANLQHVPERQEIPLNQIHTFLMAQVMKQTGVLMRLLTEAHGREHDLRMYRDQVSDVRIGLRQLEEYAYLVNIRPQDVQGACDDLSQLMNACCNYAMALSKSAGYVDDNVQAEEIDNSQVSKKK